ncbi:MAG: methylated-DNA--[protein]-cysteine S-methyltransferase [Clostridia bacterium]
MNLQALNETKLNIGEEKHIIVEKSDSYCKEYICSCGFCNDKNFFYNQAQTELVIILQGEAILMLENDKFLTLKKGESFKIPPHLKHQVKQCSQAPYCVWLCLFYEDMSFYDLVYKVVDEIPKGKITTYGDLAKMLCSPKASRAVGYALHFNPNPYVTPCHRVVNREGYLAEKFAFGGVEAQKMLLESEGIEVTIKEGKYWVDLNKYRWN